MGGEKPRIIDIIAGMQGSGNDFRPVYDQDMRATGMLLTIEQIYQAGYAGFQPGLLPAFAADCFCGVFAGIHEACWERPQAALRIVCPPHQQDSPALLDERGGCHLGVGKVNPATGGTYRARVAKTLCLS
jgi:hypothetical protein